LRGPYSKNLADNYYKFDNVEIVPVALSTFDKISFINLVKGKGELWLESATTIISIMDNYCHYYKGEKLKMKVLERVIELKNNIPQETIEKAFRDLSSANILPS
jgi:hypothetical protein